MLSKLATALVYCLVGLGAGYIIWGARIGSLTQSMNQMVLEEDTLRTRLAAVSSEEDKELLASALGEFAGQLRAHSARIAEQAEAIDKISGSEGRHMSDELRSCEDREARLEHDLEQCLFDKAVLSRAASDAAPRPAQQMSGKSKQEVTVTYPVAGPGKAPAKPE